MKTIGFAEICAMLRGAILEVRGAHEFLSKLDSAIGDGDHGTAMLKAMDAMESALAACEGGVPGDLFTDISWAVMGIDGGSTGPLFGAFFLGLGERAGTATEFDTASLAALIEGGVEGMRMNTRAQVGDKTLMDALLPALDALKSVPPEDDIECALAAAADAAVAGAEATTRMLAKYGRARNLGDRVLGHMDPGAKSMSLMLQGFHNGLKNMGVA